MTRSTIALALLAACLWSAAPAAASDGERGAMGALALRPLAVIDREDMRLSGKQTVLELLELRAGVNFLGAGRAFVGDVRRLALLVNGRNMGPLPDLDTIPLSAVERIEILDDNAIGALAGHAAAGAVNIVLREDLEGFEAAIAPVRPASPGAESLSGSALWGGAIGEGRLTLGADSFERKEIEANDRKVTRASWREGGSFEGAIGVSAAGNTVIVNRDKLRPTADDKTQSYRALGDCRVADGYTGPLGNPFGSGEDDDRGCGFVTAPHNQITTRYGQEGVIALLEQPVAGGAELFAEARLLQYDYRFRIPPAAAQLEFTPDDPTEFGGDADDLFRVAHRFAAHGNRRVEADGAEYWLSTGLRGRMDAGVGFEAHLGAYRYEVERRGVGFVSEKAIGEAIDDDSYALADPLSASAATVRETGLKLDRNYVSERREARARLNGAGFALPGGESAWSAGVEVATEDTRRRIRYLDATGAAQPVSDVLGLFSASDRIAFDGDRRRVSAFAELALPVSPEWDFVLAGRGDDYDDVGGEPAWRVATRYRLNEAIALRGSFGGGARAPGLPALTHDPFQSRPWVCDTRDHVVVKGLDLREDPCTLRQVTHETRSNPDLDAERSRSVSFGVGLEMGPVSFGVDWFRLTLTDMPVANGASAQAIMNLDARDALPDGVSVTRDGDDILLRSSYDNIGREEIAGFDVTLEGAWETGWADLGLELHWLHRSDYKAWIAGAPQPGHLARDRLHGQLRAGRGNVTANWSVLARSGYSNIFGTGRYGSWIGHDLTVDIDAPAGLEGMRLTAGILNVTDEEPSTDSADPAAFHFDLDGLRGRAWVVGLKAAF